MANWYDSVHAPLDSNGREVPLDTRELVFDGETRDLLRIAYSVAIGRLVADLANTDEHPFLTHCTLPDSWERFEKDAAKDPCAYFGCGDGSICNKCQSCPAYGDDCGPAMAQDVVRRAKALAGVDDGE